MSLAFISRAGSRVFYPTTRNILSVRWAGTTSSSATEVEVTKHTGKDKGIVTLTLNRPKAKNALSRSVVDNLRNALTDIRNDHEARVIVVRSTVAGVFCAGADLKERATMDEKEVGQFLHNLKATFCELERLPQPTIAAIDGAALGGGFELSLCCDMRVGGPKALVGLPETSLAIIPGAGGTQRLARLIGVSRTKALVFTARRLGPQAAMAMGILNDAAEASAAGEMDAAAEDEMGYQRALAWARDILPNGPVAVRMAKKAIDLAGAVDPASGLDMEQLCYAQVIPTEDRIEGLRAFKEKRKPVYVGR
ncbi:hypothetical protein H4R20_004980 [Coemansia guatemalensis]|uniref:ClpP/crotonase n=1 Tax=Coemansia guatemalensis TaxID=2761395 RepID=A0A9W8LR80_9FUNG|nr:hypothetical protein H4R20_004980 [Coemansia guatemalensis]